MRAREITGAALLALGGLQLLVIEAITASAWVDPAYSYLSYYLSDLAVPTCGPVAGREVCSPLHEVFSGSLVAEGVLFATAAVLLARSRIRPWLIALAAAHGLGMLVVAFVPETAQGASAVHVVGTATAVFAADALVIVVGATARAAPRWYRRVSVALGAIGFVSAPGIEGPAAVAGLAERIAAYAWIVWGLVTAIALIASAHRRVTAE